jgi:phytoene synthase
MTTENCDFEQEHCRTLVRMFAPDRYFSTLLAPTEKRRDLFAIYAFDAEISAIAENVSDPAIGEIRFQWWYDTLATVFAGDSQQHPVARELVLAIKRHDLPSHLFSHLIDAHRFDLYYKPMADMDALAQYLKKTSIATIDLACRILIGENALSIKTLIDKAGTAYGVGQIVSLLPQHIARKQCFVPASLLAQHQLKPTQFLTGEFSTTMKLAILQLQHLIVESVTVLRHETAATPKRALPAFFPSGLAERKTKKIATTDFNPFKQRANLSPLATQWYLLKSKLLERI